MYASEEYEEEGLLFVVRAEIPRKGDLLPVILEEFDPVRILLVGELGADWHFLLNGFSLIMFLAGGLIGNIPSGIK